MTKSDAELIDYVVNYVMRKHDMDGYNASVYDMDISGIWNSFRGKGCIRFDGDNSKGMDLNELWGFIDYNHILSDEGALELLGYAVYLSLFELRTHYWEGGADGVDWREYDAMTAFERMFIDLRTNWDRSKGTLDEHISANWAMVRLIENCDSRLLGRFYTVPIKKSYCKDKGDMAKFTNKEVKQ
jgi:hypothetical protein